MKINPNSPAYPLTGDAVARENKDFPMQGLSIRGLIAKDLMAGMLANPNWASNPIEPQPEHPPSFPSLVELSVSATDALINQLNK